MVFLKDGTQSSGLRHDADSCLLWYPSMEFPHHTHGMRTKLKPLPHPSIQSFLNVRVWGQKHENTIWLTAQPSIVSPQQGQ